MSQSISYRKLNLKNDHELLFIARIDITIPAKFDSDFLVNEENVQKHFQGLKEKFTETDFFDIAETDSCEIIGYHAIKKVSVCDKQAGSIYTFWVDPNYRNQGIGSELKKRGENWAKEIKLDHLFTWVHSDNSKMISFNKNLGYSVVNFKMKKNCSHLPETHPQNIIPKLPSYYFNDDLKEVPSDTEEFRKFIEELKKRISSSKTSSEKLKIYENLGVALRISNRLDEASSYLTKAVSLSLVESISKQIQNLIRLAHVYQWQKQFLKSKALFNQVLSMINEFDPHDSLRASYHQHLGKFYYDQNHFGLALTEFELANRIRNQIKAPQDQITSTESSIIKSKEKWSLKIPEGFKIRRAEIKDAEAIHKAHMKSINEICSKDHSQEEIKVWGGRTFEQTNRNPTIQNQFYLVVEYDGSIEGFCQAKSCYVGTTDQQVHLYGLYITPKILKQGIGHLFINLFFEYARSENITRLTLKSSFTALDFYKKYGFIQSGELSGILLNGVMIRAYPLEKIL